MLQMAKFGLIQLVWTDLDMIWVQPQDGEYVVAHYEVQHTPCRILYPQGSWAVEGDVRGSDISLPAVLYSTNEYSKHIPCAWLTARHPSLVPSGIRGMVRGMVPWAYVTSSSAASSSIWDSVGTEPTTLTRGKLNSLSHICTTARNRLNSWSFR